MLLSGVETSDYQYSITSTDALPLSYRRLVAAKAIKLGLWDKPSLTWFSKFVNLLCRKLTEVIIKFSSFGST